MRFAVLAGLLLCAAAAYGQAVNKSAKPPEEVPKLANGKPDLSGVWDIPYTPDMEKNYGQPLPYTAAGKKDWESFDDAKFDNTGHCLPAGLTRQMNTPMPMEIVQNPTKIAFLWEGFGSFLTVPTDGRPARKIDPAWIGESVGHWDGDTLVIESANFNGRTRLDTRGHPHSKNLKVTQRFARTSPTEIAYEVTIDDPEYYTKTWSNKRVFKLRPDWELMEYNCMENNLDLLEGHIK